MKSKEEILEKYYKNYEKRIAYPENVFKAMEEYKNQYEDKWISVDYYLPEEKMNVLCFTTYGRIIESNFEKFTNKNMEWFKNTFTHWQQLPQPPKK